MSERIKFNKESFESFESGKEQREKVIEIIQKKVELLSQENLDFSGISQKTYEDFKRVDEEYPGYTTPIDKLLERFSAEGMKIILGKNPDSGNVFVLPCNSDDIESDSIPFLKLLDSNDETIKELRKMIKSLNS